MLQDILNMIKSQASQVIANNTEIPEEKKTETVQATTQALAQGLKENVSLKNITQLANLFSGDSKVNNTMSPLLENLKSTVAGTLTGKVGLSAPVANSIAATVIPSLVRAFSSKVNDPNDKFNLESIFESFAGEKAESHEGLLGKIGSMFL